MIKSTQQGGGKRKKRNGFAELDGWRHQSRSGCERDRNAEDKLADIPQVGADGLGQGIPQRRVDDGFRTAQILHSRFRSERTRPERSESADGRSRSEKSSRTSWHTA